MRKAVNTERVHIVLRRGDLEKLKILFPKVGASAFIRQLVSNMIDLMEQDTEIKTRLVTELGTDARIQELIDEYYQ